MTSEFIIERSLFCFLCTLGNKFFFWVLLFAVVSCKLCNNLYFQYEYIVFVQRNCPYIVFLLSYNQLHGHFVQGLGAYSPRDAHLLLLAVSILYSRVAKRNPNRGNLFRNVSSCRIVKVTKLTVTMKFG